MKLFVWENKLSTRPQKLSALKSLKTQNPPNDTEHFHSFNHQKWLPYQILGGKTGKERQNQSTTNEDMVKKITVT